MLRHTDFTTPICPKCFTWQRKARCNFKTSFYKKSLCLLIFFLFFFYSNAIFCQAPIIQWQKSLGGSNVDGTFSLQQTKDGGYITAGFSYSSDGDVSINLGSSDGWVVKLDASGNIEWEKTLGTTNQEGIYAIRQTSDEGYIISGITRSNNVPGYHGGDDAWVVRLDAAGNKLWEKALGGTNEDWCQTAQQTSDGGYIIGGLTRSNDGDVSGFHGDADGWFVKLDANGNIQWQRALGGSYSDQINAIQQTTDGGYIVAAVAFSIDGDVSYNYGESDYWIIKLDTFGNILWERSYGGTNPDWPSAIQQTTDGGFVVAGESTSKDGDVTDNHGGTDAWIIKLDATGNLVWQKALGGSSTDQAGAIYQTSDGGYVFAGTTFSNDGNVSGNHGLTDTWLGKVDVQGNLIWQKTLGGSNYDASYGGMQQTTDAGYIVCSSSYSNDGDVSGNHGNRDYWIVKLCGTLPNPGNIMGSISVCKDVATTYSISPVNGATSYTWTVPSGWAILSGQGTTSISVKPGTNGGSITVTANNICGNSPPQTLAVVATVPVTPAVSIASTSTNICSGSSMTFTATTVNGGTTPAYQWKKNGANVGTNNATYIDALLNNNDIITCELTSSETCVTSSTATSNAITITVSAKLTPAINITSTATTICAGSSITFTATITNGGATPVYQWKKNGTNVGTNSATYIDASLNNSDIIICELTSSETCITSSTATSDGISITTSALTTPTINITSTSTNVCSGSSITFTATSTNGGTTPVYQWKKNGTNVGTNSATYIDASLNNADIISCELTSSETCVTSPTVTSNGITITTGALVTPTINITSTSTNVCSGSSITFTATSTNGGTTPAYQWKKNGTNVGTNSATYIDASLNNADVITCELTSSETCITSPTVTSNGITITTGALVTPVINITSTSTNVCSGSSITFTATSTNGGTTPAYQWKKNGTNIGTNSATYIDASLNNADEITCQLTSSEPCVTSLTATSNAITITATAQASVNITSPSTTICKDDEVRFQATVTNGGASLVYQWKLNGENTGTNSSTYVAHNLSDNDEVMCVVKSQGNSCSGDGVSSNVISITVNPLPVISVTPSDTTVATGSQVQLKALISGNIDSYDWSPASGLINPSTLSPITAPLNQTTDYWLNVKSEDGCPVTAKVTVHILKMLLMPSAFTPNGDKLNDVFRIPPNTSFKLKDFSVYNRWGQRVFFTSDINKGWDGLNHPVGTYTYFINGFDYNNKPVFIKGAVTLLR